MKQFMRICSLVLVFVLMINMLPMSVFAENLQASTSDMTAEAVPKETTQPAIVEEITQNRTEHSKQFKLSNGLYMAVAYPNAVHFQKNGSWAEIDNTLTAKNGSYTNTDGIWNVRFPQQLNSSDGVVIEKDGYTLSFVLNGELRNNGAVIAESVQASDTENIQSETVSQIETESFTVSGMQQASAELIPLDLSSMEEFAEYPEAIPEKSVSRLGYANAFANTNIIYDLQSNTVKESIELQRYNAQLRGYRYTLNTGGMIPVLAEDGTIEFYTPDKTQVVMIMPAPFMVDANMEFNHDVQVNLTGNGSIYTLTYLLPQSWLADSARAWPVILDPVVQAQATASNIVDQNVYSLSSTTAASGVLQCGYRTEVGISRAYLKYDKLPPLSNADVIVKAQVRLYKVGTSTGNRCVSVHKVLENWTEGAMNWSNMADYDTTVEDYLQCKNEGYYHWDVTDLARGWYEGDNTGMMFKLPDSVEQAGTAVFAQFWSSDYSIYQVDEKPALFIYFRNNNGLEGYWDYTASSAGRAGTGYVNDFTGNMVWIHSDIGFGGNRMPVTIQHVYNANDCGNNTFGMGYGWRTNFNQRVYQWPADSNYYVWEDSDGTSHYFYYDSEKSKYVDEDGLELSLTATGSGNSKYVITNKNGNTTHFDTYGRLTKIQNNQQTKSNISVTYTTASGYLISSVTDGAGRVYSFTYSSDLLSRISFKGSNNTEHSYVTFGYSGSNLTRITDKDTEYCSFTYTGNLLTQAQDIDGYKLVYTYNQTENTVDTEKPNRVIKICEYDGTTAGGEMNIEYAHNQTTFTDHNGNVIIKQFNDYGNTVSTQDSEGHAQYAQYAFNTAAEKESNTDATKKGNQLRLSSNMQNTVGNRLQESSFESGSAWHGNCSSITAARSTDYAYQGSYSLKLVSSVDSTTAGLCPSVPVGPGETYTFSAYVKTVDAKAIIALQYGADYTTYTGSHLQPNQDWTRMSVTYTNNTNASRNMTPVLFLTTSGTVYVDCVQMEKSNTPSRYNLLENGDFRYAGTPALAWTGSPLGSEDGITTLNGSAAPELDSNVFSITGDPSGYKQVINYVSLSGGEGDNYILSAWAKGNSVPVSEHDSNPREFSISVTLHHYDGTSTTSKAHFNPDSDSWQYAATVAAAEKSYHSMAVVIRYNFNANTVYFDGIQLYKEEFGSSYTYDEDGNVTSVVDLQKQKTTYEYSNNNLTKMVMPTGASYTYTYDDYHNVKTATSAEGLAYSFTYDTYGNNTAVSITSGGSTISSSAAYSNSGNTLSTTTDALGKVTKYGYNAQTNILEWVQYPEDTESTRTEYSYDSMYRIATATATTDTGLDLSASYTYDNDLLTKIQTPTTAYNFTYGDFGLRNNVSVGTQTLATYSYTNDRNFYLQSLDYGNGDSVNYTYDDQGRLTSQTYEDGDTVTYQYDNDGALAVVYDKATDITTRYYYDFTGRTMKYTESASGYSHSVGYNYDDINNLISQVETINGTSHTTTYDYDEDNRVTSKTTDGITVTYTYDTLGRITQQVTTNGDATILTESYTYTANSSQIATYRTVSSGYDVTYTYTYDDNGNILTVNDGTYTTSYVYDSQNQLTRENNQSGGFTHVWVYDNAGNIQSRTEYAYTEDALENVTPTDTVLYSYGEEDANWRDQLLSYDGTAIEYDEIGNPESYGSKTFTWEHGRELATLTEEGVTWTYTYDANGMRTKRTGSAGGLDYTYVYNGNQLVQMCKSGATLYFTYDADGRPLTISDNGTIYYYITNLQGDVTGIANADGTVVATYTYDAWGKILTASGSGIVSMNPLLYRGYVYDWDSGLYYLQSRYYDPEIGRFINADNQISGDTDLTGLNLFAYCGNNPVNRVDHTGEAWWHWAIGAAVVAACAVATVVTCGGFAAAATAVCMVGSGVAATTTAATVAAAAFIGSATVYGTAVLAAASSSDSIEEFNAQGNWGTVAATVGGGAYNALNAYSYIKKPTSPKSTNPSYNLDGSKDSNYVSKRGWDGNMINNAISNGKQGTSVNMATGQPCTVYRYPGTDNQYVVIEDATRSVVQVSNFNDPGWIPDSRIIWDP